MSLQRHSSPPDETDLETTAELPVLDVMAYEASVAATSAVPPASTATSVANAARGAQERDHLGSTDTWIIPGPSLRVAAPAGSDAANTAIDENRARNYRRGGDGVVFLNDGLDPVPRKHFESSALRRNRERMGVLPHI